MRTDEGVGFGVGTTAIDGLGLGTGELSRIDPALVVSEQTPFLYDGYIVLRSESGSNTAIAVHPEVEYVVLKVSVVEQDDEVLVVAKALMPGQVASLVRF